ncbi:MAG: tetratricopeptide repeat protein [Gemmatimonadetes bacterium]|nr:tetratricopeptide repeat protein [Gemmatimonadota bacterium]
MAPGAHARRGELPRSLSRSATSVRKSGSSSIPSTAGGSALRAMRRRLLDRIYGGMIRMRPSFLRTAGKRDMLVRLLTNLKGIFLNVGDHARALSAVERILLIHPTASGEVRDRGTILARLGRAEEAIEQLEWYLDYAPGAPDADRIRVLVETLRNSPQAGGAV